MFRTSAGDGKWNERPNAPSRSFGQAGYMFETLRALVEHAPEAIVVFDGITGHFLFGNDHACRLTEYRRTS
jgi:PAS domain-containing protein